MCQCGQCANVPAHVEAAPFVPFVSFVVKKSAQAVPFAVKKSAQAVPFAVKKSAQAVPFAVKKSAQAVPFAVKKTAQAVPFAVKKGAKPSRPLAQTSAELVSGLSALSN
jgi:hypothetical protein